jgi:mannose-6-phosphate isomerase-like protein (cupin superfamily)
VSAAPGYVVSAADVPPAREDGDTAATRLAIDASVGCERLEQRLVRYAPGRSRARTLERRQEVLYVASGAGSIHVDGEVHPLEPDMGVFVADGETYEVENPGPGELELVAVSAPAEAGTNGAARRVTVRYVDQPPLPAGTDREFRYLINEDAGCRDVTQFVGLIPPGRAPMHSHVYDEVVYVVDGEGVLHRDGAPDAPIGTGSCIHLPPLREHCLENVGATHMRVMGVFHPSGDPASRADAHNK